MANWNLALDNQNLAYKPESEALGVSNWVTTDGLPVVSQFNDSCDDPENFRLQAQVAGNAISIVVKLEVIRGTDVVNTQDYTLDKKEGDKLRGRFLRLVTDTNDDGASGNGLVSDPNLQTIKVKLGDKLKASYEITPGKKVEQEIFVGRPLSESDNGENPKKNDIREIKIRVVVVRNAVSGDPCVTEAQVIQDIADANERLAQSGIRIKRTSAVAEVIPSPSGFGAFYLGTPSYITLGSSDERIFKTLKDGDANSVDLFYVPAMFDAGTGTRAMAYPVVKNRSNDPSFNNWIVVAANNAAGENAGGGKPNTVPHELMHILLNAGHREAPGRDPVTALFLKGTSLDKYVTSTKRIGPYADSATSKAGHNDTQVMRVNAEILPTLP